MDERWKDCKLIGVRIHPSEPAATLTRCCHASLLLNRHWISPSLEAAINTFDYQQLFLAATPLMDVRAPVEFARGAFPSAVNLPLLNNVERHEVGIRYKQAGKESATRLGNELVSGEGREARMRQWLTHTQANPSGYLYCFRGGLRSRTVQQWLAAEGVEYPVVPGGYKAMRSFLLESLQRSVGNRDFIILAGQTGSGKTLLLKQLQCYLDLEGLAEHRGSSFGATVTPQPSNIDFENAIAIQLLQHRQNHNSTIYVEDEGKMIGRACVPRVLRERMLGLPLVVLETDIEQRIDISLDAYIVSLLAMYQAQKGPGPGFDAFAEHHRQSLGRIVKRFGGQNYQIALDLFEEALGKHRKSESLDGYRPYIRKLLCEYYDPMYDYQIRSKQRTVLFRGSASEIQAWVYSRNSSLDLP